MFKQVKQLAALLCIICLLFSGCSQAPYVEGAGIDNNNKSLEVSKFALPSSSNLRTYIDIYKSQILYMEINKNVAEFYIYDISTKTKTKIKTIKNFALKGKSNILLNNKLYFYISIYGDPDLKNQLYAVDFTKKSMEYISENSYSQKLIPMARIGDNIFALQGILNNKTKITQTFIENYDFNTSSKKAKKFLEKSIATNDSSVSNSARQFLYIDGDHDYLYAIEKGFTKGKAQYFLTKYDKNKKLINESFFNNIFTENNITDNVGLFYAFNDYFCIIDYSNNALIGKIESGKLKVLLCDTNLDYVVNYLDSRYEFFYRRQTNEIYMLDKEKGVIKKQTYELDNSSSDIRCVLSYGDKLLVVKAPKDNIKNEKFYFIDKFYD